MALRLGHTTLALTAVKLIALGMCIACILDMVATTNRGSMTVNSLQRNRMRRRLNRVVTWINSDKRRKDMSPHAIHLLDRGQALSRCRPTANKLGPCVMLICA